MKLDAANAVIKRAFLIVRLPSSQKSSDNFEQKLTASKRGLKQSKAVQRFVTGVASKIEHELNHLDSGEHSPTLMALGTLRELVDGISDGAHASQGGLIKQKNWRHS